MARTYRYAVVLALTVLVMVVAHVMAQAPQMVTLQGYVRADGDRVPVANALVTNDWNGVAATTDAHGRFRLEMPRVADDEFFVLTVKSGDLQTRRRFGGSAMRNREVRVDLTPYPWERR
jgi:hypothetical protein